MTTVRFFFALVVSAVMFVPVAQAQDIIISEFLSSNTRGIRDENGERVDWIEIYNRGTGTVNLLNWKLRDSSDEWLFPATNLPPGRFLLIFASEKNRRIPGAPLHTNFRLSSGGEYLGLIRPDDSIATEFNPYPQQAPDVSYGFGDRTTNEVLVASNSLVRVLVPNAGTSASWTATNYNDSVWTLGTNGVGFGTTNTVEADYSVAVLPTGPVGYWRFSETSGTTAANSGSGAGLNGTYSGTTLGVAGPRPPQFIGFEPGNTAVSFAGAGSVSAPGGTLNNRNAFTVGGWIRPTMTQSNRVGLFGQNDCVEFGFITGTDLQCWTPGGGSVNVVYGQPINTWHHVVAVGNGSTIRIYIDGVEAPVAAGGGSATASYGSSASPFNIGGGGIFDTEAPAAFVPAS